jgi:uncharacterized RDD family membrane protein YckC
VSGGVRAKDERDMSAFGSTNPYGGPMPATPALAYGGFWIRAGAYLIDAVLLSIVNGVLFTAFGSSMIGPGGTPEQPDLQTGPLLTVTLLSVLIPAIYVIGFWVSRGATPGKMAFGLRVVRSEDGGPLSLGQAIGRFFGYFVSSFVFALGFLWVAFDARKQGWHDKLASTVVVKRGAAVPQFRA